MFNVYTQLRYDIIIEKTERNPEKIGKKPIKRIYFTYFTSYYTTILSFMTELYLVRHGQTEENAPTSCKDTCRGICHTKELHKHKPYGMN